MFALIEIDHIDGENGVDDEFALPFKT